MIKIDEFIWVPAEDSFVELAKFIGVQFEETSKRVLIAGNVEFHRQLAGDLDITDKKPVTLFAAGSFTREGVVSSLHSVGYNFRTPMEERDQIDKIVSEHLAQIQKLWGKKELAKFSI